MIKFTFILATIAPFCLALGLKLESAKGPVASIVVKHAEKPSAN
jgi:uncharacterized protein (TIGR03435 family)